MAMIRQLRGSQGMMFSLIPSGPWSQAMPIDMGDMVAPVLPRLKRFSAASSQSKVRLFASRCASAGVYGSKIAGVSAGGLRQDFAGAKLLLFTVSAVFAEVAKSRKDLIGSRGSPFVTSWTS
jgi:hypothetical protein